MTTSVVSVCQQEETSRSTSTITFVLNGERHELVNPDPNRTLLQYLREDAGCTGTKEGCAEGDCGACTVLETEARGDRLYGRAVNACIRLLPTLHGKEITTVEGLRQRDGGMHSIQRAMIDCHASQCGFCTPGFVMSLYALSLSVAKPDREEIERALAGNLCRCTGYRPIVEAALHFGAYETTSCLDRLPQEAASVSEAGSPNRMVVDETRVNLLHAINAPRDLILDWPDRQCWAPRSLAEFARLRADHPEAMILAGGTDLGLTVTKRRLDLPQLIYVGRVEELRQLVVSDEGVEIGAAVTLADAFVPLVELFPELEEWARRFASQPIRNVGTLGGNIGNGSPIGDSMPVLLALNATLILRHRGETRALQLDDFYTGYQRNVLLPGEFIERIRVPRRKAGTHVRAYKVSKRFDQDISTLCGAFTITLVDGMVDEARIAFGGMASTPKRAFNCEAALIGRAWNETSVRDAMEAIATDFEPIDDMRASKGYRRLIAQRLLYKSFVETSVNTQINVFAYGA